MGYLGATLTQVFTRSWRSGRVTQRCHNSPRWETGLGSANDVTHRKRAEDFGILNKSVELSWELPREKTVDSFARGGLGQVSQEMVGGGKWKSQNRKNVYLSPYVEEPFNSKVIKSFVPELRSRYVFSEFRDSYVLCIYMNIICPFRISVSGDGT